MKHCTRKRNLNIDNFHSLFPKTVTVHRGQTFFRQNDFAWICFLIATNRFLHIPTYSTAMWECVLSLDLLHRVYGEQPVQQSTGKWFITSCLIILNSKWKRKWTRRFLVRIYRWRRRRLKRKCCLRFRSLSQHEIGVYILCGSRTLREIYSRFIFSKRYKTILTFPFLSLIFLLKMGISNNTKEEISIRFVIV